MTSKTFSRLDRDAMSLVIVLVYAGLAMTAFVYLTPPTLTRAEIVAFPLVGALSGDLPFYVLRFLLSAVLFGAVPWALTWLPGLTRADLGLVRARGFLRSRLFIVFIILAVLGGLLSSYSGSLAAYYPYSHTLTLAARKSPWLFVLHLVLYFVLYYIPWEIFFRGIMILPFLRMLESRLQASNSADGASHYGLLLAVASFQILPSSLIHFGHPPSEMASAVLFGVLAAWMVLKTRSVLPGLFIHATIGLVLDTAIFLRIMGILPGGAPPWVS